MTAASPPSRICLRTVYHGRVQGVGFRWTTVNIARRFAVEGGVRNLTDGAVELIAQGDRPVVTSFLSEVAATMQHYIERSDVEKLAVRADLAGFRILP